MAPLWSSCLSLEVLLAKLSSIGSAFWAQAIIAGAASGWPELGVTGEPRPHSSLDTPSNRLTVSACLIDWLNHVQVLPALDPKTPVWAAGYTMQLLSRRMQEFGMWDPDRFHVFNMRQRFQLGPFE